MQDMGIVSKTEHVWDEFWEPVDNSSLLGKALDVFRRYFWVRNFIKVALEFSQKGRVLEAGCGSAMPSIMLREIRGDRVTALDLSNNALNVAKKSSKKMGISLNIIKGDMNQLPFHGNSFDLVWNSGTLEHFINPVPVIAEMKRVGKQIIIIIPKWNFGFAILDLITSLSRNFRKSFFEGNEIWYLENDFIRICTKAGLEEIVVKKLRCFYFFSYLALIGK